MNNADEEKYQNAVDYFIGKWKNVKKPFKHNEYYAKKKQIPIESSAFRYIDDQRLVSISETGEKHYNKRKLSELPQLISKLQPKNAILYASENFIFNYEFFYYKILNFNMNEILDDIQGITQYVQVIFRNRKMNESVISTTHQIQLFALIYLLDMHYFQKYPENFGIQLSSRALIFYKFFNNYQKIIDEADTFSTSECALITPFQYSTSPGSGLLVTLVRLISYLFEL